MMDGLGSVRDLTTASQAIVEQYSYDSFGNLTTPPTTGNPYTFTGREYDPETGLLFYRARYYDPKVGRFLQQDPKGFDGGDVNFYAYVLGNPINAVDPYGLEVSDNFKNSLLKVLGITLIYAGAKKSPYYYPDNTAPLSSIFDEALASVGVAENMALMALGGGVFKLDSSKIRFSQKSISGKFKDGGSLEDLVEGLKSGKIKPEDLPAIRLVDKDGKLFTLDNRRLYALQQAGKQSFCRMATAEEIFKESWKFTTINNGISITVR
jgi:RHS repeat-associated protein